MDVTHEIHLQLDKNEKYGLKVINKFFNIKKYKKGHDELVLINIIWIRTNTSKKTYFIKIIILF